MRLARPLHLRQLFGLELVVFNGSPIVSSVVHRETRRERAVGTNDQRVLSGAAILLLNLASHEVTHLIQAAGGVYHLVACCSSFVSTNPPACPPSPSLICNEPIVVVHMPEIGLVHHRRLVDVVIGGNAVIVCYLRQLSNITSMLLKTADVDIEENRIAVLVLFLDQIVEIRANRYQCLRQTRFFVDGVSSEVEGGNSGVSEPVVYTCGPNERALVGT